LRSLLWLWLLCARLWPWLWLWLRLRLRLVLWLRLRLGLRLRLRLRLKPRLVLWMHRLLVRLRLILRLDGRSPLAAPTLKGLGPLALILGSEGLRVVVHHERMDHARRLQIRRACA
jgi:hypothetical protein